MRRRLALATGALFACVLASCGSSPSPGTAADPASAVPAGASIYAGASVRPGEPLKAAALAAGHALTRQADPYLRLLGLLQTPGSPALDFKRDLAPWLGTRAGVFLQSPGGAAEAESAARLLNLLYRGLLGSPGAIAFPFGAHGAQGAIVLDTTSASAASSFVAGQAKRAGARAASYRGVAYQLAAGGVAFGMVDRFAVIGSESGMHGVIDATQGGSALAHAPAYATLTAAAPAGTLAQVYVKAQPARESNAESLAGVVGLLLNGRAASVSLVPSASSIALDADAASSGARTSPGGLLSSLAAGAGALNELPGESWLAIGLGEAGATLPQDVRGLRALLTLPSSLAGPTPAVRPSAGLSVKGLLEGILAPLAVLSEESAQARRDFRSWMDSGGVFASGSGLLELKAGVVFSSHAAASSRAAVGKLAGKLKQQGDSVGATSIRGTEAAVSAQLPGLPVALDIAAGRDAGGHAKFVIGIGEGSVIAALAPPSTLSSAARRLTAAGVLGEGIQPSVLVDFPTLLGLLEGVGLLEDPTVAPFVPYLRSLTTLAGGAKSLAAGGERFRLVVGLQQG
jgi:hypothetical protein